MILIKPKKQKNIKWPNLAELTSQCPPFSESEILVFTETPESLLLGKNLSSPELLSAQPITPKRPVKHPGDECTHNLVLFQNLPKEIKEIKLFSKPTEEKSEELEMALQNISGKNNVN